ncbi:hypothetical protein [Persephonella sp.]
MKKELIEQIVGNNFKHVDAVFVYKDNLPVAYGFATYIPDTPDTFYTYNSHIEKLLPHLHKTEIGKLYHYPVQIGKKPVYLLVYRAGESTFVFVFLDSRDLDITGVILEKVIKPLANYFKFR